MERKKIWPFVLIPLELLIAALFGGLLGAGLAGTKNIKNAENFTVLTTALPTKLLDINGELITEFSSDEKRELISLNDLPQIMIDALITREDRIFYEHRGFSAKAIIRAVIGVVTKSSLGGGSTLSQQIAGTLYCDRTEKSAMRKIKELWWAIQMERRYSKDEILELYLNKIYFGGGTYGVNAASKYYFGHGATDITPAEAALLVIQLSNPAYYNPFEHTNIAMERQRSVLNAMVQEGYLSEQEANESYDDYWASFDYTRTSSSAYAMRDDKAPWFSEYVRRNLGDMLYGDDDIYTGGFTVNTTLNLSHQKAAEEIMKDYIAYANAAYKRTMANRKKSDFNTYIPMTSLISLIFNMPSLRVSSQRNEILALKEYRETINPIIDIFSIISGAETLKTEMVNKGNAMIQQNTERTTIEGTMIALENSTGYIDAIVGGSKYDQSNQFIRAVQSRLQPGSTFKPLYYSAAIDSRQFTMASVISDTPVVFHNADGSAYFPQDFKGVWEGDVQLWYALAHSMNVPSIKVLDTIGFDAAISRASALLGINQNELESRSFLPLYPLGLGVCSVSPIEMAKAFATFANNGKEVTPIAIRNVEDRNGNIVMDPEKELRAKQKKKGEDIQVISKQTAFIMQELLKKTVESGTLNYGSNFDSTAWTIGKRKGQGSKFKFKNMNGDDFTMPAAGKTGTTQNWADAWTVGFTPYYTAAFWFGFDRPGQSLGLSLTGSTLAGVAWGDFMHEANKGKGYKAFTDGVPEGVVRLEVCSVSGDLLTEACGNHKVTGYFLEGTEPTKACTRHSYNASKTLGIQRLKKERYKSGFGFQFEDNGKDSPLAMPDLKFLRSKRPVVKEEEEEEEKKPASPSSFWDLFSRKRNSGEQQTKKDTEERSGEQEEENEFANGLLEEDDEDEEDFGNSLLD
ncbi:MAG: PBP1A family penicillin-binding protein [Treponema sp.]|nr:PBP1A family penicillin-binding protein [Treponema sp.]